MAVLGDGAEERFVLVESFQDVLAHALAAVTPAEQWIAVGVAVGDAFDHFLDFLPRQLAELASFLAELFPRLQNVLAHFHASLVATRVVRMEPVDSPTDHRVHRSLLLLQRETSARRLPVIAQAFLLHDRRDVSRLLARRRRSRVGTINIDRTLTAIRAVVVAVASIDAHAVLRARRDLRDLPRQVGTRHVVHAHLPASITSPNKLCQGADDVNALLRVFLRIQAAEQRVQVRRRLRRQILHQRRQNVVDRL